MTLDTAERVRALHSLVPLLRASRRGGRERELFFSLSRRVLGSQPGEVERAAGGEQVEHADRGEGAEELAGAGRGGHAVMVARGYDGGQARAIAGRVHSLRRTVISGVFGSPTR